LTAGAVVSSEHDPGGVSILATVELDQAIIDVLWDLGGACLVDELVSLSTVDMTQCLADLEQAVGDHDALAAGRSAHKIAGITASMGAAQVSETARALERLAGGGSLTGARELSREVALLWSRASSALDRYSSQLAQAQQ
jgi:HPt (histidine-containing phosphotransfer) domain-containing protein